MTDIQETASRLSRSLTAFQGEIESAVHLCRDDVFVTFQKRFIEPQLAAHNAFLSACGALAEAVEQNKAALREAD